MTMNEPKQEIISIIELNKFISALRLLEADDFTERYQLENTPIFQAENDEVFVELHNSKTELTGVVQLTGDDSGMVIATDNPLTGFLKLNGNSPQITLLAGDYLTALKIRKETGYETVFINSPESLNDVVKQISPPNSDEVVLFCFEEETNFELSLFKFGIQSVDYYGVTNVKESLDKGITLAKLGIPQGFISTDEGVFTASLNKKGEVLTKWLCSPLKVSALTRNIQSKSWGRYVEVLDRDNVTHRLAIPMESLTTSAFIKTLVDVGLTYEFGASNAVNFYLTKANPIHRARSVSKTGWHDRLFIFPEKIVGETDEKIVYQNPTANSSSYEASGSLSDWKNNVATLCKGNSRLAFGVSVAFASMMLRLVGGESGGFHFRSGSSRGKTTILTMSQSVFGSPESLPRWRSTVNGLEALATNHNHTLLCLDEFSQLAETSPKSAGEAVYMLGNGEGKQRSKSNGAMSDRMSWQLLYLSAGEVSLESVLTKAGIQVRGGQEVRFIDLPADAGENLGVFDTVQHYPDGNQFALNIKDNAMKYYGTAAVAFLEEVTKDYASIQTQMLSYMASFITLLNLTGSDPQVHRVAHRFSQIAASGEVATSLGITGWETGEANRATKSCFESWIESRGGHGSQEDSATIEQIRSKLVLGEGNFVNTTNATEQFSIRSWGLQDESYFYIRISNFKTHFCEGRDPKSVENAIKDSGLLIPGKSRTTVQKKVSGQAERYYRISKEIFSSEESNEETDVTAEELLDNMG